MNVGAASVPPPHSTTSSVALGTCVALGAGKVLDDIDILKKVIM